MYKLKFLFMGVSDLITNLKETDNDFYSKFVGFRKKLETLLVEKYYLSFAINGLWIRERFQVILFPLVLPNHFAATDYEDTK